MRKTFLIALIILGGFPLLAQPSLSLKVFPAFSYNRTESSSDTLRFRDDGSGMRIGFGLIADFPLTETYYFSTGISYIPKKAGLIVLNSNSGESFREVYNVRYLQFPVSLKLYTNELSLDTRAYFQIGAIAEFKVGEKMKSGNTDFIEKFNVFDTSLLFGGGAEKKLGTTTSVYAGLSYQRGLINIINDTARFDDEVTMKNSLLTIDVGIRF